TSALYSPQEGQALGIEVLPLHVTINNQTYTELVDLTTNELIQKIAEGALPQSSQPSVGHTVEVLEQYQNEDCLVFTMSEGLSGTYASTVLAKNQLEHPEHMHIINTRTLCGPHRHLVDTAIQLNKAGASTQEIIETINDKMAYTKSFLIPTDFEFLKRGGRLSPLAAKLGGLLKITAVLELSDDGKKLDKYAIKKTESGALKTIIKCYKDMGVDEHAILYVTHAGALMKAKGYAEILRNAFPQTEIVIHELTPVFVTHGGPGCIAIQMIKK
ncbi:MAG: DegV family protein, partial [Sharpea porci]